MPRQMLNFTTGGEFNGVYISRHNVPTPEKGRPWKESFLVEPRVNLFARNGADASSLLTAPVMNMIEVRP